MKIYTDGSCSGNGKKNNSGGFGVLVLDDDDSFISAYQERHFNTTNNEMELRAILYVMKNFGLEEKPVHVYTDSSYAMDSFSKWIFSWAKKGWIKSDKQPPENLEIFKEYFNLYQKGYRLHFHKVKGHDGVTENEIVDKLATGSIGVDEVKYIYGC